ncbi:hypothetical protein PS925_04475 [Pseudomonas fluorescens]|uniref:Uncharacterized protein n=1 Tax=Pseudomonas fluorescens TaxID=294 RepID=A0A5E7VAU3_PSEFL|nr:hypothetical protein [Pseudomonas fluorescens]VVQ18678.1 hypothetical protein PS925_04475 [Pseudomonas fluorescens]
MVSHQRTLTTRSVWLLVSCAALCAASLARAQTVTAVKDCTFSPCNVTGNFPIVGRFRLTAPTFNWEALYTGTVQNFYVSQGGANIADIKLNSTVGQTAGTGNLPKGVWFISISTALMGAGSYSVYGSTVFGDPHIATTNGVHYDFQGAGEFVLLKNGAGFEVQSRMTPVSTTAPAAPEPRTDLSTCVSINTAAALKTARHRVTYQPGLKGGQIDPKGMELRLDGKLLEHLPSQGLKLDDGSTIVKDTQTGIVNINYADETSVKLIPNWWAGPNLWYLDFDMSPPEHAVGVAGPVPADGWLPALADGSSLGTKPVPAVDRYKAVYVKFADSWRVTDASTMFDYVPGTSTKDFTVADWPRQDGQCSLPDTTPLKGTTLEVAQNVCKGVVVPHLHRACLQDVMATGDKVFGRSYVKGQGPLKAKTKVSNRKESY